MAREDQISITDGLEGGAATQALQKKDLENSEKNSIFAKNNEDDGRTKEDIQQRRLVGESESVRRINQTLERVASDERRARKNSDGTERTNYEGQKERLLARLEVATRGTDLWIDDISTIADIRKKIGDGTEQESEVYLSKDGEDVIKLNNLSLFEDTQEGFNSFIDRINAHNKLIQTLPYEVVSGCKDTNFESNSQRGVEHIITAIIG